MGKLKNKNLGKLKGGQSWIRVNGPDLDVKKNMREKDNKHVYESDFFNSMCQNAGLPKTRRQAAKWNNKKGAVYKTHKKISMNGFSPSV